jgi:hypothetical protein
VKFLPAFVVVASASLRQVVFIGRSSADTLQPVGDMTYVDTISSSAATLTNSGISHISSDVINVSVLSIAAPVAGVSKEIWCDSSASTVSINTTHATITFGSSVGSSALVLDAAGGIRGTGITMRGISATQWAFVGSRRLGD